MKSEMDDSEIDQMLCNAQLQQDLDLSLARQEAFRTTWHLMTRSVEHDQDRVPFEDAQEQQPSMIDANFQSLKQDRPIIASKSKTGFVRFSPLESTATDVDEPADHVHDFASLPITSVAHVEHNMIDYQSSKSGGFSNDLRISRKIKADKRRARAKEKRRSLFQTIDKPELSYEPISQTYSESESLAISPIKLRHQTVSQTTQGQTKQFQSKR